MFELTRKVLSGTVLAAITGGVLLWGLSPGMTLKREYESYNGKPAGSEHTLQAITVPAYANVQGVTALEACTLQDGILVLAYPTCPYCRNLMPELLDAAEGGGWPAVLAELGRLLALDRAGISPEGGPRRAPTLRSKVLGEHFEKKKPIIASPLGSP